VAGGFPTGSNHIRLSAGTDSRFRAILEPRRLKIADILLESGTMFPGGSLRFHPIGETNPVGAPPSLLVSVRNASEARAALKGGCAILDVKEPSRGSLGMANIDEIGAVVACRNQHAPGTPVSIALGEAIEWEEAGATLSDRFSSTLLSAIEFVKLGTAGLANDSDWSARFQRICQSNESQRGAAVPQWVAVGYADWTKAAAPAPKDVVATAAVSGCRGVLIDTCSKAGAGLFDCLAVADLKELARSASRHNLWFALAGRLSMRDLSLVREIAPAIVGIRSAACLGGQREAGIDAGAVRAFQSRLAETFALRPAER
jgi:uncharacterized protein (UPF0264 family)